MLFKDFGDVKIHRYFCDCCSPDHTLEIIEDFELQDLNGHSVITIGINARGDHSFWKRLFNALKYVFKGNSIEYVDFVICEEDREELARAILGKTNE